MLFLALAGGFTVVLLEWWVRQNDGYRDPCSEHRKSNDRAGKPTQKSIRRSWRATFVRVVLTIAARGMNRRPFLIGYRCSTLALLRRGFFVAKAIRRSQ